MIKIKESMANEKRVIFIIIAALWLTVTLGVFLRGCGLGRVRDSLRSELSVSKSNTEKLESDLRDAFKNNKELELKFKELDGRYAGLEKQTEGVRSELANKVTEIADKSEAISHLEKDVSDYKDRNRQMEEAFAILSGKYENLKKKFKELASAKKKIDNKLKSVMDEIEKEEATSSLGTVVISK